MPKRTDIKSIMIIGSGPIVIGQACEFDYSGVQACKALREEGFRVILVNSNPATIMTDTGMADATYVEPVTWEVCAKIIEKERPDALLPTLGGQTGLNTGVALAENGILEKYNVEMIGADLKAIQKAESRDNFKAAMEKIGIDLPNGRVVHNMDEARKAKEELGLPLIVRPAYTMGGVGGGLVFDNLEFEKITQNGLALSPINEVLIEESLLGWKEFEMEVMRDKKDNVVIICSIENIDALGIHTGDSITVAPAQTLSDKEYQRMRDASIACIREIGVETGGSNVQFAVNPVDGRMVIIEMNPRVSRSSALASKATGFPIAKIAAKLAVGYTLDEIQNDITRETPACFEPTIDYVVTKVPRFTFEKFAQAEAVLGSQMKSVGEAMAIGRTFKESLQKAIRSMEVGFKGLGADGKFKMTTNELIRNLDYHKPGPNRILGIKKAFELGWGLDKIYETTRIDPWFLNEVQDLVRFEQQTLSGRQLADISSELLREAKENGYSDGQLAFLFQCTEGQVRGRRQELGINAVFKTVDTCAAEFQAFTPYHYSTYEEENESVRTNKRKVIIIGGGPNRIGQGIEFDYCCCHASFALQEEGYESIMINSNPETVSTDYDTSDKLYFEPLNFEEIFNIVELEKPDGIIVQFGGQTPLKLAGALEAAGAPILGTSPKSIELAEDRKLFAQLIEELKIQQPPNGVATDLPGALKIAERIGYPVLVRPSFVLGGRAMMIVYNSSDLTTYMQEAVEASEERPVLIDQFLEAAIEVDVDAICDGERVVVAGIMEHIEEAGVHSGDSACVLPPIHLSKNVLDTLKKHTVDLALKLEVKGLLNVQYAVQNERVFILEANPRASRTIPFVSKALGVPLAKLATKIMIGKTLEELGFTNVNWPKYLSVKESVFPFSKFRGVDTVLSPEMKSTGEVMGIDYDFGMAFAKSQMAAGNVLPVEGTIFVSVNSKDKASIIEPVKKLCDMGFKIFATRGTADALKKEGVECECVNKIAEGHPHILDLIQKKQIDLLINTPQDKLSQIDDGIIRADAILYQIPYTTTLPAAVAAVEAIKSLKSMPITVCPLQQYHQMLNS